MVEANVTGRKYQREDAWCGEGKGGIALLAGKEGNDTKTVS